MVLAGTKSELVPRYATGRRAGVVVQQGLVSPRCCWSQQR